MSLTEPFVLVSRPMLDGRWTNVISVFTRKYVGDAWTEGAVIGPEEAREVAKCLLILADEIEAKP